MGETQAPGRPQEGGRGRRKRELEREVSDAPTQDRTKKREREGFKRGHAPWL